MSVPEVYQFRQAGPATLVTLFFGAVVLVTIFFGWKSGSKLISDFNAGLFSEIALVRLSAQFLTFTLMWVGFFHFFGPLWLVGFQTSLFCLFGFYAIWVMDKDYTFMYLLLTIFNWLSLSGRLPFLGYGVHLADMTTELIVDHKGDRILVTYFSCESYFYNIPQSRCESGGYLNFLRLIGLGAFVIQAIMIYLAYRIWRLTETYSNKDLSVNSSLFSFDNGRFPVTSSLSTTQPISSSFTPTATTSTTQSQSEYSYQGTQNYHQGPEQVQQI